MKKRAGRKPKDPSRVTVPAVMASDLVAAVSNFAEARRMPRTDAINLLLLRGLGSTTTKLENIDAIARAALRGDFDAKA